MTFEYFVIIVMASLVFATLWVVYRLLYSDLTQGTRSQFSLNTNKLPFIAKLIDLSKINQALLLFVQSDQETPQVKNSLLESIKDEFGEKNLYHLIPSYELNISLENYFTDLGKQCHFLKSTPSKDSFLQELEEKLEKGDFLFLLVSEMERSLETGIVELARVFRSLTERYENFRILIIGGEKLADLYFTPGHPLSLLNNAEAQEWPELNVEDVVLMLKEKQTELTSFSDFAKDLLQTSGGHLRLLEEGAGYDIYGEGFQKEKLQEKFMQSNFIWRLFQQIFHDLQEEKKRLHDLLQKEDVGEAQPHITDPLLRKLYWNNLLKKSEDGKKLIWRSEFFREVGLKIWNTSTESEK